MPTDDPTGENQSPEARWEAIRHGREKLSADMAAYDQYRARRDGKARLQLAGAMLFVTLVVLVVAAMLVLY